MYGEVQSITIELVHAILIQGIFIQIVWNTTSANVPNWNAEFFGSRQLKLMVLIFADTPEFLTKLEQSDGELHDRCCVVFKVQKQWQVKRRGKRQAAEPRDFETGEFQVLALLIGGVE